MISKELRKELYKKSIVIRKRSYENEDSKLWLSKINNEKKFVSYVALISKDGREICISNFIGTPEILELIIKLAKEWQDENNKRND